MVQQLLSNLTIVPSPKTYTHIHRCGSRLNLPINPVFSAIQPDPRIKDLQECTGTHSCHSCQEVKPQATQSRSPGHPGQRETILLSRSTKITNTLHSHLSHPGLIQEGRFQHRHRIALSPQWPRGRSLLKRDSVGYDVLPSSTAEGKLMAPLFGHQGPG